VKANCSSHEASDLLKIPAKGRWREISIDICAIYQQQNNSSRLKINEFSLDSFNNLAMTVKEFHNF
jgi:hypothetical protein